MSMLNRFGSIFIYKQQLFVWLDKSVDGRIFAAQILNEKETILIQRMSDKYDSRPHHPLYKSLSLCFVVLNTNEYKGLAASFHRTGDNVDLIEDIEFIDKVLSTEDIEELKKTILNDSAIPKALIQKITDLS